MVARRENICWSSYDDWICDIEVFKSVRPSFPPQIFPFAFVSFLAEPKSERNSIELEPEIVRKSTLQVNDEELALDSVEAVGLEVDFKLDESDSLKPRHLHHLNIEHALHLFFKRSSEAVSSGQLSTIDQSFSPGAGGVKGVVAEVLGVGTSHELAFFPAKPID